MAIVRKSNSNVDKGNPCTYGECLDQVNGFICSCDHGHNGTLCDMEVDECLSEPCLNDGSCTDNIGSFSCSCAAGYVGETCGVGY